MKNKQISKIIFITGTTISILGGWFAGYKLTKEVGLTTGIMLECIALIATLWTRIVESETNLLNKFEEAYDSVKLANRIAATDEPILTELYQEFVLKQKELSEGRYELKTIEAVYEDDRRSIEHLKRNEVLRNICPVAHTPEEIKKQFNHRSYVTVINAHKEASIKGVKVIRIYAFLKRELYENELSQRHLNDLVNNNIECKYVILDDHSYNQAKQIDTDFAIFGDKKVSIGTLDPATGTVNGARIRSDIETIRKYIREFEMLSRISKEHTVTQKTIKT